MRLLPFAPSTLLSSDICLQFALQTPIPNSFLLLGMHDRPWPARGDLCASLNINHLLCVQDPDTLGIDSDANGVSWEKKGVLRLEKMMHMCQFLPFMAADAVISTLLT
jgi:hypothetical protein